MVIVQHVEGSCLVVAVAAVHSAWCRDVWLPDIHLDLMGTTTP